jgi:hypothetical protein
MPESTISLKGILRSLRRSQSKLQSRKRSAVKSLRQSLKKKSLSKKRDASEETPKFGCAFRRRTNRCIAVPGLEVVDSSCRRVKKHGEYMCRKSRKARSYKRKMSARSLARLE